MSSQRNRRPPALLENTQLYTVYVANFITYYIDGYHSDVIRLKVKIARFYEFILKVSPLDFQQYNDFKY